MQECIHLHTWFFTSYAIQVMNNLYKAILAWVSSGYGYIFAIQYTPYILNIIKHSRAFPREHIWRVGFIFRSFLIFAFHFCKSKLVGGDQQSCLDFGGAVLHVFSEFGLPVLQGGGHCLVNGVLSHPACFQIDYRVLNISWLGERPEVMICLGRIIGWRHAEGGGWNGYGRDSISYFIFCGDS